MIRWQLQDYESAVRNSDLIPLKDLFWSTCHSEVEVKNRVSSMTVKWIASGPFIFTRGWMQRCFQYNHRTARQCFCPSDFSMTGNFPAPPRRCCDAVLVWKPQSGTKMIAVISSQRGGEIHQVIDKRLMQGETGWHKISEKNPHTGSDKMENTDLISSTNSS